MNLSKENYVKSIMYFKEIGDLIALFQKDGQQYFVCWADTELIGDDPTPHDIYTVVAVDQVTIDSYLAKQITGHEIQKRAAEIYVGSYRGDTLKFERAVFAELDAKGFTMTAETSFYDETLTETFE